MTTEEKKEAKRLYMIEYRKTNPNKGKEYMKNYVKTNPNKSKEWRENNKDKIKKQRILYRKNNPEKIKQINLKHEKNRKLNDPIYKMSCNIRSSIWNNLVKLKENKKPKTIHVLGCSFEEFKEYIESKFEDWMTWDNHGLYNGWDLDHIIPTSSATTEEELFKLYHYSNYQPLCSYNNRYIKKDNIIY